MILPTARALEGKLKETLVLWTASNGISGTTSIASVYRGYFENGRRYQSLRDEEYFLPTDEKQWESMEA